MAKSRCDHVGNDATDIAFLRWVVVRPSMVAGNRHGPGFVTCFEFSQEACCVLHVSAWDSACFPKTESYYDDRDG